MPAKDEVLHIKDIDINENTGILSAELTKIGLEKLAKIGLQKVVEDAISAFTREQDRLEQESDNVS